MADAIQPVDFAGRASNQVPAASAGAAAQRYADASMYGPLVSIPEKDQAKANQRLTPAQTSQDKMGTAYGILS